jgi:hypothetical protein
MNLQQIEDDLLEVLPENPGELIIPYELTDTLEQKFKTLYRSLRRSRRLKNRQMSLIHAYFLGKFLEENDDEDNKYEGKMTTHYLVMSRNTYDLFEEYPEQILRTKSLTVQRIKTLKRTEILDLRRKLLEFFVGTQILRGGDCYGEDYLAGLAAVN